MKSPVPPFRTPAQQPAILFLLLFCPAWTGCVGQDKYDEALRINGELQQRLDQAGASLRQLERDLSGERARNDRLAIEKADYDRRLKTAIDIQDQLRRSLEIAREDLKAAEASLDRQRSELKRILDAQKEAAARQGQEIADRDREIDVLKSRVRQLEDELRERSRSVGSAPTAQPRSSPTGPRATR